MNYRRKTLLFSVPVLCLVISAVFLPLQRSNGYTYTYTVQPGDTLNAIGVKFDVDWSLIASANAIAYPYWLSVGETLTIPLQSTYVNYTVVDGDSLYTIAENYQVPWINIASYNGIPFPYIIYAGQTLMIPLVWPGTTTAVESSTGTPATLSTQSTVSTVTETSTVYVTSIETSTAIITSTTSLTSTQNNDPIATGNSVYDQYDSIILAAASEYGLDPMVLKAQIALESYFNSQAVSPDDPCGQIIQGGVDVGHSYGLLQMTPACISWFARNPDGSIDLASSQYSTQWGNSAFNPVYNIYSAALAWYGNLQYAEQQFPGCTQSQYVDIGLSAYNAGFGSVYSCTSFNSQGTHYIDSVMNWYQEFSSMSGWADPYQ